MVDLGQKMRTRKRLRKTSSAKVLNIGGLLALKDLGG